MARLIDADMCIEKIKDLPITYDAETVQRCIEVLSNAQTIDAEPVRHGKWIETEENHGFDDEVRNKALACSVCRVAFRISDYAQIEDFRYCPNCGADMRGEQDG